MADGCTLSCADGKATDAEFCFPNGLALSQHSLFVSDSDNRRIRKVDTRTGSSCLQHNTALPSLHAIHTARACTAGQVSTFAGGGGHGYSPDRVYQFADSHGDLARFGEVRGIALDAKDNLYVADMFHYRIVSQVWRHFFRVTIRSQLAVEREDTLLNTFCMCVAFVQRKITPDGTARKFCLTHCFYTIPRSLSALSLLPSFLCAAAFSFSFSFSLCNIQRT